jgi:hypothetical protein
MHHLHVVIRLTTDVLVRSLQLKIMAHVTRWPASEWNWDQALSLAPSHAHGLNSVLCSWKLTRLCFRLRSKIMASISYLRSKKDRMLLLQQLDVSRELQSAITVLC